MISKYPAGFAEGIYFNIPNEAYHNDPALSHSGMTKLLVSWQDYWVGSVHNPARKEFKPTEAMIFGERSGMYLLEREKFYNRFGTYDRNGGGHKGTYISSIEYKKIKASIDAVTDVDIARQHFEYGYPEVSIFWRDSSGIMLRVRIDYLRVFGAIDFKRIAQVDNWGIGRAVKAQGLDIQHFLYLEGIKAARIMLKAMIPKKRATLAAEEKVKLDWLEAFMADTALMFRFLFQRSTPPYIWEFRELEPEVVAEGCNAVGWAVKRYKEGIDKYGTAPPPMGEAKLKTISTYHVPRRDYEFQEI